MLKFSATVVKSSLDIMRLFKRPDNGVWYAELFRNVKRSLHTKDEQEAKVRFKELQQKVLKDKLRFLEKGPSISLSEFFHEYALHLRKNHALSTCKRVERITEKFTEVIGKDRNINGLTRKDMDRFVDYCRERKNSPVTINIEMRHIKAAFSYAADPEVGYLKVNPFKGYKQLKYQKKQVDFIEDPMAVDRVFRIIDQTPDHRSKRIYRLVFALYIYTGARRSEIWKLEWKDIKEDMIVFRERKNYEMLEVPIVDNLKTILSEYERGVGRIIPLTIDQMSKRIKYFLRQAGMGHLRPHDLRHTFASHLLMSGVDMETVRRLLGQTSLVATKTYSHILERHKKKEIRKLPY